MSRYTRLLAAGAALWAGTVFGAAAPLAPSQPEDVFQRTLFYEKEVRDRLEAAAPPEQKILVEWGGFYIPSYTFFTDAGGKHGHVTLQDLRLWTQIQVDGVHRAFARMRLDYVDFAAGDSGGLRPHDLDGPNLEVGYYEISVSGAAAKYAGQKWPFNLYIRGGRQYTEVGRGIALGKILDVGSFEFQMKDWAVTGFAGQSPRGQDDVERIGPRFSTYRRAFYGGQVKYRGIDGHEPYAFFVIQKQLTDADLPTQGFNYDSGYYGVGSRGAITRDLHYALEGLWEVGRGTANGQVSGHERIRACAFDSQLDYYVPRPMKPVLTFQFAYASGDGDRQTAISSMTGNRLGTTDTQFQGFGYVNSGLALGARFANLQFVRLAGRVTPYEKKSAAGRIDVGLDYYFLFKSDREGPISDFRADRRSAEVGNEVDVFLEWRILSDLSWTVRYGRFFPGSAYTDRGPRDFLFTGLNFSF